jgi:hypothetical protein
MIDFEMTSFPAARGFCILDVQLSCFLACLGLLFRNHCRIIVVPLLLQVKVTSQQRQCQRYITPSGRDDGQTTTTPVGTVIFFHSWSVLLPKQRDVQKIPMGVKAKACTATQERIRIRTRENEYDGRSESLNVSQPTSPER